MAQCIRKQQCTDVLLNCSVLSKGHLSDKTKTRYTGKESILPNNWNSQEKMASFGAHKPFSPSATEAASLKVSIKQGFYLKMYCPHSPLYTLKEAVYKPRPDCPWALRGLALQREHMAKCTLQTHRNYFYSQLFYMGRLITDVNFGRASGSWQTEAARPTNLVPSDVLPPLVHSNVDLSGLLLQSGESQALSTSHSCQNLCVSWDPSVYKAEYCWEGSPNYVMILKAN